MVYQLGSAAQEAQSIRSLLEPPEEPNAYRGLSFRSLSGPLVEPSQALKMIEEELKEVQSENPNPLQRRLREGTARLASGETPV
jgi:hypothetical protein